MNKTFWGQNTPDSGIIPPSPSSLITVFFWIWDPGSGLIPEGDDVSNCQKIQFSWNKVEERSFRFANSSDATRYIYDGDDLDNRMLYYPSNPDDNWIVKRIDIQCLYGIAVPRYIQILDHKSAATMLNEENDYTVSWINTNNYEIPLSQCFGIPSEVSQRVTCLELESTDPYTLPIWFYMYTYQVDTILETYYTQYPYYGGIVGYIAPVNTILNYQDSIFYCSNSVASRYWDKDVPGTVRKTYVSVGDAISSSAQQAIADISYIPRPRPIPIPFFKRENS